MIEVISILQLVVAYTTSKYSFYRNYDDCYVFWKSISRMSQWEHILVTIQMEKSSYWRFYRMYLLYVEVIFVISTLLKYLYKRKSRIHKGIYILKLVYAVSVFFHSKFEFVENEKVLYEWYHEHEYQIIFLYQFRLLSAFRFKSRHYYGDI